MNASPILSCIDDEYFHKLHTMSSTTTPAIELIRQFHRGTIDVADSHLERALQIRTSAEKRSANLPSLLRRFGNQNFTFGGMPFRHLRQIFRIVSPRPDQLFCDAGAGYGHVVFYGACVARCRFRAIEILPVRYNAMIRTMHGLGFQHIEIIRGDALAQSYEDVDYLFLNNPFFPDLAKRFIDRLVASRQQPLTVIAMHNIVDLLRGNAAFAETEISTDIPNYCFGVFVLKQPGRGKRATSSLPSSGRARAT
jgi:hypothetical protein